MRLATLLVVSFLVGGLAKAGPPEKLLVIPFDFESTFDQGAYGKTVGTMVWEKLRKLGGFVLPESMQDVRDWCERERWHPGPATPLARMSGVVRNDQAGDIGIWGKVERVPGNDFDVYDFWICVADFRVDPPKVIYQKAARTKTVSEIPHVYVREALEALTGKAITPAVASVEERTNPALKPVGRSLVRGDFEKGRAGTPAGWDPLPPGASWVSEAGKAVNNHVIRFRFDEEVAGSTGVLYYSEYFPVEPGATYRFRCRWKSTGSAAKVFIKGYDELQRMFRNGPDGSGPAGPEKREVYRSQQNLTGPANTWNEQVEDFTPKHAKFTPKWGRVMLYGYWPAGNIEWDDVSVEKLNGPGATR